MSLDKINFLMSVRGYKKVKKQKKANLTDVTAVDALNNKVLLRIIEPFGNEYIRINDVKTMTKDLEKEDCSFGVIISKKFTDTAINEMADKKIQYISHDYMPPFEIEDLYGAIFDHVNNQCMKKCGLALPIKSGCTETKAYTCRISKLARDAKFHFEDGLVGLLKNDLKMALALDR